MKNIYTYHYEISGHWGQNRMPEKLPEKKESDLIQLVKNKKNIKLLISNAAFKIHRKREIIHQPF